jgi:hypothetical protein
MDWSQSKLIRIESGQVNISTNDLRALLNHYNMDAERIAALVDVARAAREVPRWNIYRDIATPEYIAFLGYEASATVLRSFEPLVMPGLLQIEEYARTVISVVMADEPRRIDPLVDLRVQRQELLVREPPPSLHFIVDEAVIRRVVGGRDIMRRQLSHLQNLVEYPNITIRIAPFEQGYYPRMRAPYTLFEFAEPEDGDVLYIENPQGEYIIREDSPEEEVRDSTADYLAAFWKLEQIARREHTPGLLQDAITRLTE